MASSSAASHDLTTPTTPRLRPATSHLCGVPPIFLDYDEKPLSVPALARRLLDTLRSFESECLRFDYPIDPEELISFGFDQDLTKVKKIFELEDPEGLRLFYDLVRLRPESTKASSPSPNNNTINSPPDTMASSSTFPALDTSIPAAGNRSAGSSPTGPSMNGSNGLNGASAAAAAAYMPPLPVGHQQDLNHLFNQIQDLGQLLRSNRDKVNSITRNAEEVAKRANGAITDPEPGAAENDKARIRELELELSKQKHLVELYKHEQKENTGLIAMYEEAMGTAVEQVRNYCGDIEGRFIRQRKHYNDLLQQEKDDHLASRLDRDHWYAQTLKVCEMIRTASRLRNDEWADEYTVIASLQGQVRCLRRVFGMEKETPEEEAGWPYLKDLPLPE